MSRNASAAERNPRTLWTLCLGSGLASGPLMVGPLLNYLSGKQGYAIETGIRFGILLSAMGLCLGFKAAKILEDSYRSSSLGWMWALMAVVLIPLASYVALVAVIKLLIFAMLLFGCFLYALSGRDDYY